MIYKEADERGYDKDKYKGLPWVEYNDEVGAVETIEKLLRKAGVRVTITVISTDDGAYYKVNVRNPSGGKHEK